MLHNCNFAAWKDREMKVIKRIVSTGIGSVVVNMLMAYVAFEVCRVAFFVEHWSTFAPYMSLDLALRMLYGGFVFDTSALLYINALYIVMTLLPLHLKEVHLYHQITKWVYIVPNALGIAMNLSDAVYFAYTGRRTTATVFSEFVNENNIASIVATEFLRHWYFVLLAAVMVWAMWRLYRTPRTRDGIRRLRYYVVQVVSLAIVVPITLVGMRGSTTAGTRPITISNAHQYVDRAIETAVVLNTPFALFRTIGKPTHVAPNYMTVEEMVATYNPEHYPTPRPDSVPEPKHKNVIILICESLAKEYTGFYNQDLYVGEYKGSTPFVDSIAANSLTYKYSYANGHISMDANPSILSSIPMFVEPFVLSTSSLNDVDGVASLLAPDGYHSAYFHGGHNITMGFSAYANAIGYERYFGLDEYERSPKYGGYADFDGKWAIFDEPFLQYVADEIETFEEPFVATIFTATSHHPFPIPAQLKEEYPDEGDLEILKCIRYADMALHRFFDRLSRLPWYDDALFVIVADHTSQSARAEYKTDLGTYAVPIIFFTPDGSLEPQLRDDIVAGQIDIMPTILSYVGCSQPYMAFGQDLLTVAPNESRTVNYNNGIYQIIKGDYLLQFDGKESKAMYNFKSDPMLTTNIIGSIAEQESMERELKAIIQQYMLRMIENRLTIEASSSSGEQ